MLTRSASYWRWVALTGSRKARSTSVSPFASPLYTSPLCHLGAPIGWIPGQSKYHGVVVPHLRGRLTPEPATHMVGRGASLQRTANTRSTGQR
jgi:hypothetical protein